MTSLNDTGATPVANNMIVLAANIVIAYVSRNQVMVTELPGILKSVHGGLVALDGIDHDHPDGTHTPAVSVKKSVTDDYIICLEDGKKLRTLKRYLKTQFDLTPEDYRRKWNLPRDYPMVAPAYTRLRSAFAKKIGLGHTQKTMKRRPKK